MWNLCRSIATRWTIKLYFFRSNTWKKSYLVVSMYHRENNSESLCYLFSQKNTQVWLTYALLLSTDNPANNIVSGSHSSDNISISGMIFLFSKNYEIWKLNSYLNILNIIEFRLEIIILIKTTDLFVDICINKIGSIVGILYLLILELE